MIYLVICNYLIYRIKDEASAAKSPSFYLNRKSLLIMPNNLLDKVGSNDSMVPLLLNAEQWYDQYVSSSNPTRIQHNVDFLVNIDALDDCKTYSRTI